MKLEDAELAKKKLSRKLRELETASEAEKQKAMEAAADKLIAEIRLKRLEAKNAQLKQEKNQLKVVAEQEKRKAAEAAKRERETANKAHQQELSRIVAKSRLEEVKNRNSKLENELALIKNKLDTRNHTLIVQDLRSLWQFALYFITYFVLLLLLLFEVFEYLF